MLKLFKRRDEKKKSRDHANDPTANTDAEVVQLRNDTAKRNSLRSTTSFCESLLESDEDAAERNSVSGMSMSSTTFTTTSVGGFHTDEDIFNYRSRLSMTLPSIVNDPNCLSYFVQFLDTKHALALIKFYLDTENFKTAARSQLEKEETSRQQQMHWQRSLEATGEEAPAALEKNVPELKTLCDLSMGKPLTDDEKSEIYAETNKQLTKTSIRHGEDAKAGPEPAARRPSDATASDVGPTTPHTMISDASTRDAIAIYQKYLIANAKQFVSLPVGILEEISLLLCNQRATGGHVKDPASSSSSLPVTASCFDRAQEYVLAQMERDYLSEFLQSTFYCKYCLELLENTAEDKLTIYDVLYSEVTLFFFMEFLEQHGERNCLDFWTTAINYRKSYAGDANEQKNDDTSPMQTDAMIIYEKFFSLQADCRLWMSDKLRSHVEERICADGQVYAFDLPLQIAAKYLEKKYFSEFLKSPLFENYLLELKTKIHEELSIGTLPPVEDLRGHTPLTARHSLKRMSKTTRHRKTLSDCSNESSSDLFKHISQHNTLLAMDTSASTQTAHFKNLRNSSSNLSIDSRQLTNPNLLWHRSCSSAEGGLKFGHINALGRYERDFDAVDAALSGCGSGSATHKTHNWSLTAGGAKIKNAMRKLVNLPEEKVQEEIAWQVAEMIIKDVTSVTLNGKPAG